MSSIESQVRDAFASIEPPEGVRMRTLAAIEARRGSQIAAPDARKAEAGEARAASRRGSGKGLPARKRLRFMVAACLALAACLAICRGVKASKTEAKPPKWRSKPTGRR